MVLIFFTIMFLLVGFILISVGVWAKETLLPDLKKETTAYLGQ